MTNISLLFRCYICSDPGKSPYVGNLDNGDDIIIDEQCIKKAIKLLGAKNIGSIGGAVKVTIKDPTN